MIYEPTAYKLKNKSIFVNDTEIPIKSITKAEEIFISEPVYPNEKSKQLLGYVMFGWLMPTRYPSPKRIHIKYRAIGVRIHFDNDFRTIYLFRSALFQYENTQTQKALEEMEKIKQFVEKNYYE